MKSTGTVTRRAAKEIPPQVCSPPRTKCEPIPKRAGKNLKRHATESSDDKSELSDLRPKVLCFHNHVNFIAISNHHHHHNSDPRCL